MRSDERCEHGCEGGTCSDEKCPGYWLDATARPRGWRGRHMSDPARETKLTIGTEKPKRAVVTLYGTPPVDPTYSTVLFRVKLADESYFEVDLSSVDAQRLGNALNLAGGGSGA